DDSGCPAVLVDYIAEVFGVFARTVAMNGDDEAVARKIERDGPTYSSGCPSNQRTCSRLTHVSPVCLRHHIYGAWRRSHRPRWSQNIVMATALPGVVRVLLHAEIYLRKVALFMCSAC